MYSQEQVIGGLILFIKGELMPILPDYAKVLGGAALLKNANKMTQLLVGDTAKKIGIVEDDGNIDVDLWLQNIKASMRDYSGGMVEIKIPMLAPIKITESDVDTLKRYIKGELQ